MKGYKGFGPGLICRGKQYEVGKTHEEPEAVVYESGMHFCERPEDVLDYYGFLSDSGEFNEFAEVEALADVVTDDRKKYATTKLRIVRKLCLAEYTNAVVESILDDTKNAQNLRDKIGSTGDWAQIGSSDDWAQIGSSGNRARIGSSGDWAQIGSSGDCAQIGSSGNRARIGSSGDWAQIGSSGDCAQIGSSGDCAQIGSTGDWAQIGSSGNGARIGSSGDWAQIGSSGNRARIGSSGDCAQIGSSDDWAQIGSSGNRARIGSSGDCAQIGSSGDGAKINSQGENAVVCCAGANGVAKAKVGSWITLAEWKDCVPVCVKTERVDGERIKADTWYKLVNGEFTEV